MLKIVSLYFAAVAYSAVRYVVFAPKNLENLPVFVVNKGVSIAAAFCFALAFWYQWRGRDGPHGTDAAAWFRAGIFGAFVHVPMSLAILRPGYFKEFFAGDRLSFNGEAVFLFGALTAGGDLPTGPHALDGATAVVVVGSDGGDALYAHLVHGHRARPEHQ